MTPQKISKEEAKQIADEAVREMVIEERIKKMQEKANEMIRDCPGAAVALGTCRLTATLGPVKGIDDEPRQK